MAESSSTSSSDASAGRENLPSGAPKAFLLALALIALVEVGVRAAGPRRMSPYALGEKEYDAVAAWIEDVGPAEVSFIGTSRGREAIALPLARSALEERLGRPIEVGNYSCAGARAPEVESIVEAMLRRGKPALVMYGVEPRLLLGAVESTARMAQFWDIEEWKRQRAVDRDRYGPELPVVLRAEASDIYRTLRYRSRAYAMVYELFNLSTHKGARTWLDVLTWKPIPSPLLGDLTPWQRSQANVSLDSRRVSDEHVERYVQSVMENGRYELTERKAEQLRSTVKLCNRANVPIVLFEVPISELLQRHLPPGTMDSFRRIVQQVATEEGVRFVPLTELGVEVTSAGFLEQSHMNLTGATSLTVALTEKVIAPTLRRRD